MKAKVTAHMGNIFEGGADLTVLPCSAKRTCSSAVKTWIGQFRLSTPEALKPEMRLSDVTEPIEFPDRKAITKYYSFAASVLNDATTPDAIETIGCNIGLITRSRPDIRIVQTVLFGTGAGRLLDSAAAKALGRGFRRSADKAAQLCIFVYGHERQVAISKALNSGLMQHLLDAVVLTPSFAGIGVNFKKLFKLEK